ncbi:MFS transporter [Candidatus Rhodobacter oscarellae]|uniref:MFS transporter n=1 Tax=Candidatus Rhodobacter oscarellae TaxID=1675527 RepID=UPI00128F7400|nr:MFS transporter [Candidatus Rhodobacter lobularis]
MPFTSNRNTAEGVPRGRPAWLPAPLKRIAILQACMNAAHFAAMPMLAVLVAGIPGAGAKLAGTALVIYFVLSRTGPLVLAPLAERFGLWNTVTVGLCLRGASFLFLSFLAWTTAAASGAIPAAALLGLGQAAHEAGIYGVMGRQAAQWRDRLLVLNGQALNVGCVVGPLAGMGLALWSPAVAFAGGGIALLVLGIWSATERSELLRVRASTGRGFGLSRVLTDRLFLLLCVALVPFWAVFAQLFAAFPMLAAELGGSAAWANSILIVNGLVGVVALALVARWIECGLVVSMLFAGLAVAFATVAGTTFVQTLLALLALVVLFSVGESFVMAASDILTGRHADGRSTALYFGCLNASAGIGAAIGGYVGAWDASGSKGGLLVLAACGALSVVPMAIYATDLKRLRGMST